MVLRFSGRLWRRRAMTLVLVVAGASVAPLFGQQFATRWIWITCFRRGRTPRHCLPCSKSSGDCGWCLARGRSGRSGWRARSCPPWIEVLGETHSQAAGSRDAEHRRHGNKQLKGQCHEERPD